MKGKRLNNAIVAVLFLVSISAYPQDKLYRIDPKKVIDCKIVEIGEDQIRYSTSQYSADLTFSVDKNHVEKIEFANGEVLAFSNSMFGAEHYESQRKQALKLSFLTPIQGYTEFGYERSIKPGQSMDYGLAIIGLGWDIMGRNAAGFGLRAGYKFMTSPTYYKSRQRYAHILKGAYVKPEISFLFYNGEYEYSDNYGYYDIYNTQHRGKESIVLGAFNVIGGKQWIFADRFLIDVYVGMGYAFGKYGTHYDVNHFIYSGGAREMPLVFTGGFRIGLLL